MQMHTKMVTVLVFYVELTFNGKLTRNANSEKILTDPDTDTDDSGSLQNEDYYWFCPVNKLHGILILFATVENCGTQGKLFADRWVLLTWSYPEILIFHSPSCSCVCRSGFEGDRCETNIDDCAGHACQNNATCNDLVDMYSCICPVGYTGELKDKFQTNNMFQHKSPVISEHFHVMWH